MSLVNGGFPHHKALSDPTDYRSFPPPRGPNPLTEPLKAGMFVDARDSLGRWLEASVLDIVHGQPKVHYTGWEAKWDEIVSNERIAPCHLYSISQCENYKLGQKVYVFVLKPAGSRVWSEGVVRKGDGCQVQVEYLYKNRKYHYWYHVLTDEIRLAPEKPPANGNEQNVELKTVRQPIIPPMEPLFPSFPANLLVATPPVGKVLLQSTSMLSWDETQVAKFIEGIGSGKVWAQYALKCVEEGIDGRTLIVADVDDLIGVGFTKLHAKALVSARDAYVPSAAVRTPPPYE